MDPLRWAWARRLHFSSASVAGLGYGAELWKHDPEAYECGDVITSRLKLAGFAFDTDTVWMESTLTILDDVVDAAGGVELAAERVHVAVEEADLKYARWAVGNGELPEGGYFTDPTTELAWYAVAETLVWLRTLDERLRRPARDRSLPDQGLVMALADGARRDAVMAARSRLLSSCAGEARYLAGLSLHMQPMHAGSKSAVVRGGRIFLPFPDPTTSHVTHRWALTFLQDRDAVSFVDGSLAAVSDFMDGLVAALETHVPGRLRRSAQPP